MALRREGKSSGGLAAAGAASLAFGAVGFASGLALAALWPRAVGMKAALLAGATLASFAAGFVVWFLGSWRGAPGRRRATVLGMVTVVVAQGLALPFAAPIAAVASPEDTLVSAGALATVVFVLFPPAMLLTFLATGPMTLAVGAATGRWLGVHFERRCAAAAAAPGPAPRLKIAAPLPWRAADEASVER